MELRLTPLELRYLATCYPLKDRPGIDEANRWKALARDRAGRTETRELPLRDIALAFPHVCGLAIKGFFEMRSVQDYFEGLDQESHIMRLYLFARSAARKSTPEHLMLGILQHTEGCSVRIADASAGKVWGFGGIYALPINTQYFSQPVIGRYMLVHGHEQGHAVAIRAVSDPVFQVYSGWFEDRHKSKDNPFVPFRATIEDLLAKDI